MNGAAIRAASLFDPASGRCVVAAFDHGGSGMPRGGEDAPERVAAIVAGGPDAVLLGQGLARLSLRDFAAAGAPRLIIALDAPVFSDRPGTTGAIRGHRRTARADEALRDGATAAKVVLPLGTGELFADSVELVARAARECQAAGLPLIVEPVLWGTEVPPSGAERDALIAHSTRAAWELGADLVKIHAPEQVETLALITRSAPGPVLVLGGAPTDTATFLRAADAWIRAGARGIAAGRNVWSRRDPRAAIAGLRRVVHDRDLAGALRMPEQP
ncbi:hypothetical protein M4I32_11435 [Microbacterium sp. LRZ72]|uniref:class I fructose-bisphosphate aldolase n=1 Tax=Microbacterium sp. LRZ72 TaxID=2942481 RepID=UPI0029BE7DAF|nr:hypothetical protein [Microbacterium sp. LRZ72]MDX2377412.1 hypothetical protein [Microbacterium sp. LRZ72]